MAGYQDHDNRRTVFDSISGTEVAEAGFGSYFLSPSVTVAAARGLSPAVEILPSATLTYGVAWYEGYRETGTTRTCL